MRSEPKFYLKNNNATKKTPINLGLKIHSTQFKYGIKKSIEPELWDKTTQRPTKDKRLFNEYKKHIPTLKEDLKDIENRIINIDRDTRFYLNLCEQENKVIDHTELRKFLDSKYKTVITPKKSTGKTINEYLEYFIDGIETGKILISSGKNFGQKYESNTVVTWKEWQTQFNLFQDYYGKLKWDDIDMNVYDEILNFFYNKDYAKNTVGKIIKNFKAILRRAYRESHHSNNIAETKEFRVLTEEIDKVTLTFDELESLENSKVKDKTLDLHRDIFLIGCYTALRISDIIRLKKTHITEDNNYIKIRMKKVTDNVTVPINTKLKVILKKYNYEIPSINIQDYGVNIKKLCKDAEIKDPIEIKSSKGGSISYFTKPKHDLITSHSARRTGATLMFLSKIPPLLIMKITGHKKEKTFMKYINVPQEQVAELLANSSFFA